MKTLTTTLAILALGTTLLTAEVSSPQIFGDHMVLQRNQENPVRGKADPGEKIWVTFDSKRYKTVAGEDKVFVNAQAEFIGKAQVKVRADGVDHPVAVRYAWAMNPVCNLCDRNGLPVTPFRTDDW